MTHREGLINGIIEADRVAFEAEVLNPSYQKSSLRLSSNALRYILIPEGILRVSREPARVQLNCEANNYVVWGYVNIEDRKDHVLYIKLNAERQIPEAPSLWVTDYEDREEFRGKGVGTTFYRRLHDCARMMGFRFIFGHNNPEVMSFFVDKLGRVPLKQTKPEIWDLFSNDRFGWGMYLDRRTIDFLYPEDRERYFDPEVTKEDWRRYGFRIFPE